MEKLLETIYKQVEKTKDYRAYNDLKDVCRETLKTNVPLAVKYLKLLSERISSVIVSIDGRDEALKMFRLHKSVLRYAAPS